MSVSQPGNDESGISGLQSRQVKLENIVYLVVTVLLVGFATIFLAVGAIYVNAYYSKQASYEELVVQVSQQNAKIDELTNQISQENNIINNQQKATLLSTTTTSTIK